MQNSSISELLSRAQLRLTRSESARLDAELLLACVLNVPRETFYAHPDDPVPAAPACDYWSLIDKRAAGFPIAYLTGHKEFWSADLTVNRHTLIPRPETECLVETALELIADQSAMNILDLGTGSGAIAIAVAGERPQCRVLAVDIAAETLQVAQANALHHRMTNIRFQQSDWFSRLENEVFDVILCNPPYVDSGYHGFTDGEIGYEPRIALDGGHRGLQVISHLIPAATRHLQAGGYLVLEHGYDQAVSVANLMLTHNFTEVRVRADFAGHDRVSYARLT